MEKQERNKRKTSNLIMTLVIILCSAVFVVSVTMVAKTLIAYMNEEKVSSEVRDLYKPSDTVDTMTDDDEEGKQTINSSIVSLQEINPDVVGWLTLDDTVIDYAFAYSGDDSFYLDHDIYKNYSIAGALFLSSVNTSTLSDYVNLIHGHYMGNGSMFNSLKEWADQDFYDEHRTGSIKLSDSSYELEVFAFVHTDTSSPLYEIGYGYGQVDTYIEQIKNEASVYSEEEFGETDKVIVMSTCAGLGSTDQRYLLFAKATLAN